MRATIFLSILCFSIPVFYGGYIVNESDDPPKKKKEKLKEDTVHIQMQEQRSLNIKEANDFLKRLDSLNAKQDTLIKKK
jgi:hypothetical protein